MRGIYSNSSIKMHMPLLRSSEAGSLHNPEFRPSDSTPGYKYVAPPELEVNVKNSESQFYPWWRLAVWQNP